MALKDKTTVTLYNGLTAIGGPMTEVAYNKSHVLSDLGEVYQPELNLPSGSCQALIKYQLIDDVPGFYDPTMTGKQLNHEKQEYVAAYISYLHLDHSRALNLLVPKVPLYAGSTTAALSPVLSKNDDLLLPATNHEKDYTRSTIPAKYKTPIKTGDTILEA